MNPSSLGLYRDAVLYDAVVDLLLLYICSAAICSWLCMMEVPIQMPPSCLSELEHSQ